MKNILAAFLFLISFSGFSNPIYCDSTNLSDTVCASALPYSFNGNSLSHSGTYSVVLQNINSCDSIVVLNLTVLPTYNDTISQSVCQSALPFVWNTISYTQSGLYTDTLQTLNGCDSIVTLNLTVINTLTSTENISVCEANLPYAWHGTDYSVAGTYSDTLQAQNGCDSIAVLSLFVIANPQVNLPDTSVCTGQTIVLSTLTTSFSCDLATPICVDGTTTYPNQTNVQAPAGNNYGCLGNQPNPSWFYFTVDQGGTMDFSVTQTVFTGSGSDVDFILYGPYSSYTEAQTYCGNLGTATTGSSVNTVVACSYSNASTEQVTTEVTSGQVFVLMVTNYSNESGYYTFSPGTGDATIDCTPVISQPTTYLWSTGETTSTIAYTPDVTGPISVTISNGSCPAFADTAQVTVNALPEISASDVTINTGESAVLAPDVTPTGGTFLWQDTGETTPSITVTLSQSTTYTVDYTVGGCTTTGYINVFIGDAGVSEVSQVKLQLYPNPAGSQINLKSSSTVKATCKLTTLEGRLIQTKEMNGTTLSFDLAGLPAGIYHIQIADKTLRFVKE